MTCLSPADVQGLLLYYENCDAPLSVVIMVLIILVTCLLPADTQALLYYESCDTPLSVVIMVLLILVTCLSPADVQGMRIVMPYYQ